MRASTLAVFVVLGCRRAPTVTADPPARTEAGPLRPLPPIEGTEEVGVPVVASLPPTSEPATDATCSTKEDDWRAQTKASVADRPIALTPPVDLDADGRLDAVLWKEGGPVALVYLVRGGCARQLGMLRFNNSGSPPRLAGRNTAGFAIVTTSERYTFDEHEHRVEWDGKAFVATSRSRTFQPALGGAPSKASPWSAWTKDPPPSP